MCVGEQLHEHFQNRQKRSEQVKARPLMDVAVCHPNSLLPVWLQCIVIIIIIIIIIIIMYIYHALINALSAHNLKQPLQPSGTGACSSLHPENHSCRMP